MTVPAATGNLRYQDYTNFAAVNRAYNISKTRVPSDCAAGGSVYLNHLIVEELFVM